MLKVTDKKNGTVPEGYQLTSIGIIPLDWDLKPLGMIADEITQTAGTEMYETVSISAGIGFVNQAKKFGKELSGNQYEKYIVLHKGDFSYNKGNSQKYPQGCIYRLTDRETAAVPNVFESFRIKDGIADYFEQLFISGFLNRQLFAKINHGVRDNGLLNLTGEDFYSCKVPFPPIKEQKKIAEILIQYDKIIELCKCKLEKVIKLKKVCMDKMFPEQEKTIPEIRFPGFSDSWEQRKLGEIVDFYNGDRSPRYPKDSELVMDGVPFINAGDLVDGKVNLDTANKITKEKYQELSGARIRLGDIIYCLRGTLGKSAFVDNFDVGTVASSLVDIRPRGINGKYLFHILNSHIEYRQRVVYDEGAAQPNLSVKNLSQFTIPVSDAQEQKQIADFFGNFDNLITLCRRELDEMVKMKRALMQQLLTGKVRVKI